MEIQQYYYFIIPLIILQSIAGVGILVVGTPLLLLLNFSIIEIMSFLLPISIFTSVVNICFIKLFNKNKLKFYLDNNIKKYFLFFCLPGIFFGINLIKNFQDYLSFELLVSSIIIISLMIKYKYENLIKKFSAFYIKIILLIIGIIHGVSNSGGTLLSLFLVSNSDNKKNQLRYQISFYYFFLALFQYLIFSHTFSHFININQLTWIASFVFIGSLIGNLLNQVINEIFFKRTIEFIAFLSAIFLLVKNFN